MKNRLFIVLLLLVGCSSNPIVDNTEQTAQWIFVANEGNFGASNGSISMINNNDEVYHIEEVGDVVQSLEVYEDKLLVVVNNSHMIKVYDISEDGLSLPGIEISTDNSSPRELVVVDDKVYFTNWNTKDVKVLNLFNYSIESSISDSETLIVLCPNSSTISIAVSESIIWF